MDDEIKGEGNSVNYKYRMHDPRVGRFFATDPLEKNYPHNGPYNFSENRVIDAVELEGLEALLVYLRYIGDKPYLQIVPDHTVKENALAPFQIRIPANIFNGQDTELIYRKNDITSVNPNFDFIELQQKLYDDFEVDGGDVNFEGKKIAGSTSYGSYAPTNNMGDFSILLDASSLTGRSTNAFIRDIHIPTGGFNEIVTAPESSDGVAHYNLNINDRQLTQEGTENVFTITNITTGVVMYNSQTQKSTGGQLTFEVNSGDQFQISIQRVDVADDLFDITGTVSVAN
jgi:hypothetical protein